MIRLASCVWLQNYFFKCLKQKPKHRFVILAAASQKKERRSHSYSILKLALYLSINKTSADLKKEKIVWKLCNRVFILWAGPAKWRTKWTSFNCFCDEFLNYDDLRRNLEPDFQQILKLIKVLYNLSCFKVFLFFNKTLKTRRSRSFSKS